MQQWWPIVRQAQRIWHRPQVRGIERIPDGACLIVSNHSGGMLSMDAPILFEAFVARHGWDRPAYVLAHDVALQARPPVADTTVGDRARATRRGASRAGERRVVLDFPAATRMSTARSRTPRSSTFTAGPATSPSLPRPVSPIVPVVSIGGQETLLFLTSGDRLASALRFPVARPKWLGCGHPRLPADAGHAFRRVPAEPADAVENRGPGARPGRPAPAPDADDAARAAVDKHVRAVMQRALNQLARERRLPVLG